MHVDDGAVNRGDALDDHPRQHGLEGLENKERLGPHRLRCPCALGAGQLWRHHLDLVGGGERGHDADDDGGVRGGLYRVHRTSITTTNANYRTRRRDRIPPKPTFTARSFHNHVRTERVPYIYGKPSTTRFPKSPFIALVQAWLWSKQSSFENQSKGNAISPPLQMPSSIHLRNTPPIGHHHELP